MKYEFQSGEMTAATGVKLNRLQQWMNEGWVKPSVQVAEGTGTRNIFSREDIYKIILFKKAIESGLARKNVAQFLAMLEKNLRMISMAEILNEGAAPGQRQIDAYIIFWRKGGDVISMTSRATEPGRKQIGQNDYLHLELPQDVQGVDNFIAINVTKILKDANIS